MIRKRVSSAVALFGVLIGAWLFAEHSAAADCTPALYRRITAALKDPDFKDQAQVWVRRFQKADPTVHRGMLKAAVHQDVKALKEGFQNLPPRANPFGSEDEIYRVIGELTDDSFEGAPGLTGTVGNLFANTSSNEKGALLTLKVADETRLADKLDEAGKFGFERNVTNGGASRRYDMREPGGGAPSQIGGVVHENKNWTVPLVGPSDGRLTDFAKEFKKDILIHADSSWNYYRINLRTVVQGQSDLIRDRLLREFDSDAVTGLLTAREIALLKADFIARWNAGLAGPLLKFY